LARYAEQNSGVYRRIEVVAQIGGTFRTIDLTEASARGAVFAAETIKEIYEGDAAVDYVA
jgi:type III restriction enzyme